MADSAVADLVDAGWGDADLGDSVDRRFGVVLIGRVIRGGRRRWFIFSTAPIGALLLGFAPFGIFPLGFLERVAILCHRPLISGCKRSASESAAQVSSVNAVLAGAIDEMAPKKRRGESHLGATAAAPQFVR